MAGAYQSAFFLSKWPCMSSALNSSHVSLPSNFEAKGFSLYEKALCQVCFSIPDFWSLGYKNIQFMLQLQTIFTRSKNRKYFVLSEMKLYYFFLSNFNRQQTPDDCLKVCSPCTYITLRSVCRLIGVAEHSCQEHELEISRQHIYSHTISLSCAALH